MSRVISNGVRGLFNAIFRPAELVAVPNKATSASTLRDRLGQAWRLTLVYLVNLALYAGPLTLAGIGIQSEQSVPNWLIPLVGPEPTTLAVFVAGFMQNSIYLLGVTVATLVLIHVALLITLQSEGFLRTAYSIVYSTSAYLAGIFTVVWYLSTAGGVANARQFVIDVQVAFIYAVLDAFNANLVFRLERPTDLATRNFSPLGEGLIVLLGVLVVYYLYSLYLGTRINHNANRYESLLVLIVVIALPMLYVFGSIVMATNGGFPGL